MLGFTPFAAASFAALLAGSANVVVVPTGVLIVLSITNPLVWGDIDDSQPNSWSLIGTDQTAGWAIINDDQTPGWSPIRN